MQIRDVAQASGLSAKTIRYYEDIGLIHPARDTNGYRSFTPRDLEALSFVARARALGFSIADCATLLQLKHDPARASADVQSLAQRALSRIDARLDELLAMKAHLTGLVGQCHGDAGPECAILDGLSEGLPETPREKPASAG